MLSALITLFSRLSIFFRICTLLLIYLLAFLLPLGFILGPITVLSVGCWLLSGGWKDKIEKIRSARFLWIWIAFFMLNLISLMWTENRVEGMMSLQVKLPLLFVPIIISTIRFDTKQTRWILAIFICGLIVSGLFMLSRSTYIFFTEHINTFYYQDFSSGVMHPSYLSMYYCVGIMILFHGILLQSFSPKPWKIIAIGISLFFAVVVFLLSSKIGMLSMILIFIGYIVYSILRFKRYFVGAAALLTIIVGFFVALKMFPTVAQRFENLKETFASHGPINPTEVESNRVRLLIWQADYALVERHPWNGVGIGDVQDSIMKEYQVRGMTGAYEKKLNAHSQLFQTAIAIGIPGLILLLLLFVVPTLSAIRNQFGFLVLFTSLVLLNIIPESMFQLQAGVIFFSFFYSLILFSIDRKCLSPMKAPPISFLA